MSGSSHGYATAGRCGWSTPAATAALIADLGRDQPGRLGQLGLVRAAGRAAGVGHAERDAVRREDQVELAARPAGSDLIASAAAAAKEPM